MVNPNRIRFLDSLRGVAILLVMGFHYFSRWSQLYPYGAAYQNNILFANGWVGVELFFMISGFVILMTVERCASFSDFMLRRWLRLFPAMLIATLFILATAHFLPERPAGKPTLLDTLPGLFFFSRFILNSLFNNRFGEFEPAFWSLFIEVGFYLIFGGLYFLRSRGQAIAVLVGLFVLQAVCALYGSDAHHSFHDLHYLCFRIGSFLPRYFGWFVVGICCYVNFKDRQAKWLAAAIAMALLNSAYEWLARGEGIALACAMASVVFIGFCLAPATLNLQNSRLLQFFGFISYPLYLIHENLGVALIIKTGHAVPGMPGWAYAVVAAAIASLLAYVTAKYLEPRVKELVKPAYQLGQDVCGSVESRVMAWLK